MFFATIKAQTTQEQSYELVFERMSNDTLYYDIYFKGGLQPTGKEIITSAGEVIEINYESWIYYIFHSDANKSCYLIINESNGNLLEIKARNDEGPDDLAEWNKIGCPVPFSVYCLTEFLYFDCNWNWAGYNYNDTVIIVNSNEELKKYIPGGDPDIDFSKYTFIWVGGINSATSHFLNTKRFLRLSSNEYKLEVTKVLCDNRFTEWIFWDVSLLVDKINEGSNIDLNFIYEDIFDGDNPAFLKNTKWKLEGIVDIETDNLIGINPNCYYESPCYTLIFHSNNSGHGYTLANNIFIRKLDPIEIRGYGMYSEEYDGFPIDLTIIINLIESYSHENNELKFFFYYENIQYYLLYKLYKLNHEHK